MRATRPRLAMPGELATSERTDRLTSLSVWVAPEGDTAVFTVHLEETGPLYVSIPFQQIGMVENAVRHTTASMSGRLSFHPSLAASQVYDLITAAQRPEAFEMFQDPVTGDLIFAYVFAHGAPMALRVDPHLCLENMASAMRMIRSVMN